MDKSDFHGGVKLGYLKFSLYDYLFFSGMLVLSLLVGIYFGIQKKQYTAEEYLLGGRKMRAIPVALSISASYFSGVTLLGLPAEVYTYGTQFTATCLGGIVAAIVVKYAFLPVFHGLHLTSCYEYPELRFCKKVRLIASFLFLLDCLVNLPLIMFTPALALNLITGANIKVIIPIVCFVCILYTALGGIKAVVLTDTVQFVTMIAAIMIVLLIGVYSEGGIARIWRIADGQDKLHFFNFDFNPTKRLSFLAVTFGTCFSWISYMGVNQLCIQRFLSVGTLVDTTKVLFIGITSITIVTATSLITGLILVSKYYGCDPLTAGVITRSEQILPFYVMDTLSKYPGLPGLFITGIFSASLGSMSSYLNSISGVLYKDYACFLFPKIATNANANNIMRVLVVVIGTIGMLTALAVDHVGNLLELTISFAGVTNGVMLGSFVMGMMFSRANSKGTISGAFVSIIFMAWMLYGNSAAINNGAFIYPRKPFSVDQCDPLANISYTSEDESRDANGVFFLYRISFIWYSVISTLIVLIVALPVSYLTNPPHPSKTKLKYFSPVVRRFLPSGIQEQGRETGEGEEEGLVMDTFKNSEG